MLFFHFLLVFFVYLLGSYRNDILAVAFIGVYATIGGYSNTLIYTYLSVLGEVDLA